MVWDCRIAVRYETYYNTKLAEILNAKIVHPNTNPVDENANKRYKYEVCDLVYRDSMYFVKIGQPSDFAYAVDQAMFTLSEIQNGYGKVKLPDGTLSEPKEFHLVLICENRKTIVSKWNDIYSVNFLIHMVSLKQDPNIMNISLKVHFVYNVSLLKLILRKKYSQPVSRRQLSVLDSAIYKKGELD